MQFWRKGSVKRALNIKMPDGGRVKFPEGVAIVEVEKPEHVAFLRTIGTLEEVATPTAKPIITKKSSEEGTL